ncbi:MAG: helix-turn-helix domain-containing protein [Candidatus Bathyarchaeota archaeon]
MKDKTAYNALSSESRLKILKLLHKNALSVEEIAKLMDLQPITVRHHLQSLQDAGFIENYEERSGTVGRPRVFYQIAKEPTTVGYPKRRYMNLSNFLIKTLQSLIGTDRTSNVLKRVGENMGINVIKEIESKNDVKSWTPETFSTFFIKEYLEKAGAEPEITTNTDNEIMYRVHNCLFLELAVKMPETMCDVLHESFHDGVSKAMGGNAKIIKLTCMGHGDTYCEHKCEWQT